MHPRPLSVPEAAATLRTSESYVRRQLAMGRLYGVKVGPVWAIYAEDLESFQQMRRPRGRPRKTPGRTDLEAEMSVHIASERIAAGTDDALLKPHRPSHEPRPDAG